MKYLYLPLLALELGILIWLLQLLLDRRNPHVEYMISEYSWLRTEEKIDMFLLALENR